MSLMHLYYNYLIWNYNYLFGWKIIVTYKCNLKLLGQLKEGVGLMANNNYAGMHFIRFTTDKTALDEFYFDNISGRRIRCNKKRESPEALEERKQIEAQNRKKALKIIKKKLEREQ